MNPEAEQDLEMVKRLLGEALLVSAAYRQAAFEAMVTRRLAEGFDRKRAEAAARDELDEVRRKAIGGLGL